MSPMHDYLYARYAARGTNDFLRKSDCTAVSAETEITTATLSIFRKGTLVLINIGKKLREIFRPAPPNSGVRKTPYDYIHVRGLR
jgi:hypothetical protein